MRLPQAVAAAYHIRGAKAAHMPDAITTSSGRRCRLEGPANVRSGRKREEAPKATADAQEIGGIVAGNPLAETWCSSCHVVGPGAASGTSNGVPTFGAIAQLSSTTIVSLRVFLQTPHAHMPDVHLSRGEIDDLASYILSLRHR